MAKKVRKLKKALANKSKLKTNSQPSILGYLNKHVKKLNNSKFFAGLVMILMNIGSKYITLNLSKSQESYLKYAVSRQLLIFSVAWMATKDIITSLVLTTVFVILANYLFNENSRFCVLPKKFKDMKQLIDTNNDGVVSDKELQDAMKILAKAKNDKNNMNVPNKSPELSK